MEGAWFRFLDEADHLGLLPWILSAFNFDKTLNRVRHIFKCFKCEAKKIAKSGDLSAWGKFWLYFNIRIPSWITKGGKKFPCYSKFLTQSINLVAFNSNPIEVFFFQRPTKQHLINFSEGYPFHKEIEKLIPNLHPICSSQSNREKDNQLIIRKLYVSFPGNPQFSVNPIEAISMLVL